jgi:hypothetical protein
VGVEIDEARSNDETRSVKDSVRLGKGQVGGYGRNSSCRDGDVVRTLSARSGIYQVAAMDHQVVDCHNTAESILLPRILVRIGRRVYREEDRRMLNVIRREHVHRAGLSGPAIRR